MKVVKTGHMPEKILTHAHALSSMIRHLSTDSVIKKNIANRALRILGESFGEYVDAQSVLNREMLHHVYEWNEEGDKKSRLFKHNVKNGVLTFSFLPSKEPSSDSGYVFANKAYIMENGIPVYIRPTSSNVLVFEVDGEKIFTPYPVTVRNPGGTEVKDGFENVYRGWIVSNLPILSLTEHGFFKELTRSQLRAVTGIITPGARMSTNTRVADSLGKRAAATIGRYVQYE
jgi:hypothetical protein